MRAAEPAYLSHALRYVRAEGEAHAESQRISWTRMFVVLDANFLYIFEVHVPSHQLLPSPPLSLHLPTASAACRICLSP